LNPSASPTVTSPIKFGILGAARISPIALISPASNHPETIVYAVAARDNKKATTFAKKHGIGKVYSGPTGYQRQCITLGRRNATITTLLTVSLELLDDPEVDAVYNPVSWARILIDGGTDFT
jgi:hypothetical protein